jgi:hypothetical protein
VDEKLAGARATPDIVRMEPESPPPDRKPPSPVTDLTGTVVPDTPPPWPGSRPVPPVMLRSLSSDGAMAGPGGLPFIQNATDPTAVTPPSALTRESLADSLSVHCCPAIFLGAHGKGLL